MPYIALLFLFLEITAYSQTFPPEFFEPCSVTDPAPEPPTQLFGGENQTCSSFNWSFSNAQGEVPFIPTGDDPVKIVKVNIFFITDGNGWGHFSTSDPEAMDFWNEIETKVNQKYGDMIEPDYTGDASECFDPNAPFLTSSKVQFEFNYVELDDEELFLAADAASDAAYYASSLRSNLQPLLDVKYPELKCNNGINMMMPTNADNLVVVENGGEYDACCHNNATYPSYSDLERVEYVHMDNRYSKYLWMKNTLPFSTEYPDYSWEDVIKFWLIGSMADGIAHELGHCLGLAHYNELHGTGDCLPSIMHGSAGDPGRFLPPTEIGKMHRALTHSSARSKTTIESLSNVPIEITGTETWDTDRKMYRPITVKQGGHLKITCTLRMHPNTKIIVEQGGRLTLDGGVLTNWCDRTWGGVEVWGNTNLKQTPSNQGLLVMKNEAVLSNAQNGVTLMKPNDWSASGGYIQATNSFFVNNKRSVEFLAYKNIQSNGYEANNRSYFRDCVFINNDDYVIPEQGNFTMITMYKVKGVGIYGCTFSNERTVTTSQEKKSAIFTIDANFRVAPSCNVLLLAGEPCPEAEKDRNDFRGFDTAVRATGAEWNVGPEVREADFSENMVGIEFDGTVAPSAIFNHMTVGNSPFPPFQSLSANYHLGIKVNNCDEYIVEENTFTGDNSFGWNSHGVYTYDKTYAANSNEIYKNSYTNISSATIASGNHADPNTETSFIGLRFICNQNQGNTNDFELRGWGPSGAVFSEISNYMHGGIPAIPAGNTFSSGTAGDNVFAHFDFHSNSAYSYLKEAGNTDPLDEETVITNPGSITVTTTPTSNTCLTHFPEPGPGKDVFILKDEVMVQKEEFNNLYYTYLQVIDQGNTQGMLAEIDLTWPQNAWDLHAELMARSPNNSEDVLIRAAERNILTHGQLLEILLANSDALRSGRVLSYIRSMTNPMPDYMIQLLIIAVTNPSTARYQTERALSTLHLEMVRAHKGILNYYSNDSLAEYNPDTLMQYFSTVRTVQGRYQQMFGYTTFGEYSKALLVADSIVMNYRLSPEQGQEINNARDYLQLLQSVDSDGRNTAQLTPAEISQLQSIAMKSPGGIAAERAENILCFFYDFCLDDNGAPKNNSRKVEKPNGLLTDAIRDAIKVTLAPNPADHIVEIEYDVLMPAGENLELVIYDLQGRPLEQIVMGRAARGIKAIDTRGLPNGVFVYELLKDDTQIKSGKFVVQH